MGFNRENERNEITEAGAEVLNVMSPYRAQEDDSPTKPRMHLRAVVTQFSGAGGDCEGLRDKAIGRL